MAMSVVRTNCFRLQKEVLQRLKEGADPNARDEDGNCAVHVFIARHSKKHSFDCLMTLLIHGRCDLDKPDRSGDTALHLAAAVWRDGGERERGVGGLVEVRWGGW